VVERAFTLRGAVPHKLYISFWNFAVVFERLDTLRFAEEMVRSYETRPQGLKPALILERYAALKRRSSTLLHGSWSFLVSFKPTTLP
jgi:hypothetical protein